jgi:DNA-binding transcriptional regulator LsrR (DeoR family)
MDDQRFELLAKAASLYYEQSFNQNEIAAILGYSRSHISRMLTEARREGIVEIHVHHPLERVPVLERRLKDQFSLQEVQVLQSSGLPYPQMLRRLGALAASLLAEKVTAHSILGISWGTALYEVANMLQPMDYPEVRIVQLIGSATSRDHQVDGPGLARTFSQQFGGQYYTLAAPWFVRDIQIREALMEERHIGEVLDLAKKVDIALVGIGTIDPTLSSLVRAGYLTLDEIDGLKSIDAVGDVCGHHFDIQGILMDVPLAGYPFGIDAESLRGIPLAIGVAGGMVKAPAILGAMRSRLVNSLVTDDAAARTILELCSSDLALASQASSQVD